MKNTGIILLIIGVVMTIYSGFSYFTKEKVVDIGSLEITADKEHTVNWQPYVGVCVMVIGGAAIVFGGKKPLVS